MCPVAPTTTTRVMRNVPTDRRRQRWEEVSRHDDAPCRTPAEAAVPITTPVRTSGLLTTDEGDRRRPTTPSTPRSNSATSVSTGVVDGHASPPTYTPSAPRTSTTWCG